MGKKLTSRPVLDRFFKKGLAIVIVGFFILIGFNNCGRQFQVTEIKLSQQLKDHQDLCAILGCRNAASLSGGSSTDANGAGQNVSGSSSSRLVTLPARLKSLPGYLNVDCLDSNEYDACIFWKNPVAQRYLIFQDPARAVYSSLLQMGTDLINDQIFGVKLLNRIQADKLESTTFRVGYHGDDENFKQMTLRDGRYLKPYATEHEHETAQVMAYYWLNHMEQTLMERTGVFYAAGKSILVDAFVTFDGDIDHNGTSDIVVKSNASFMPYQNGSIYMGYVENPDESVAHEMALSAEVYIHEMGHGNLYWASSVNNNGTPQSLNDNNLNQSLYDNYGVFACTSAAGCFRAIHEGQADFYNAIIFSKYDETGQFVLNSVSLGETWFNNVAGIDVLPGVPRDPRNDKFTEIFKTNNDIYDGVIRYAKKGNLKVAVQGEIHDLGAYYASILWQIYSDPKTNKPIFEKTFMRHLSMLNASSRFVESREALLAMDMQLGGWNQNIIQNIFKNRGL